MDFEKLYQDAIKESGDFSGHMETVWNLLQDCNHATEFGTGLGESSKIFLRKEGLIFHSYEIDPKPEIIKLFADAKAAGRDAHLHIADTTKVEIEETDILLVDSYHSYKQVFAELNLHGHKVRKYIVFHDTEKYGFIGQGYDRMEDNFELGIIPAIDD